MRAVEPSVTSVASVFTLSAKQSSNRDVYSRRKNKNVRSIISNNAQARVCMLFIQDGYEKFRCSASAFFWSSRSPENPLFFECAHAPTLADECIYNVSEHKRKWCLFYFGVFLIVFYLNNSLFFLWGQLQISLYEQKIVNRLETWKGIEADSEPCLNFVVTLFWTLLTSCAIKPVSFNILWVNTEFDSKIILGISGLWSFCQFRQLNHHLSL